MAFISFSICAMQNLSILLNSSWDYGISDDILDTILITDKKLLHFKLSQLGQILHFNTGFLRTITNTGLSLTSITISLHCHFNGKVYSH